MTISNASSFALGAAAILAAACGSSGGESVAADDSSLATELAIVSPSTLGGAIGDISAADFAAARDNFNQVEELTDGVGPIFNERACGNCHDQGASGGAGLQIERRFGRFVDGKFDPMANAGGSLRQLFSSGTFTSLGGQTCTIPVEQEPANATVHDVGRLTTPLFGLGLVDAMPDAFFDDLAAAEPAAVRGHVNRVSIVLPNPTDPSQHVGDTRVARFGWKGGVPTLTQFAADAYLNEMGITTQHCIAGVSITAFATESAPNGVPMPAGCDDLAPPAPEGVPIGTDDAVGSCGDGKTALQGDVENFRRFMTHLGPPPRGKVDSTVTHGGRVFASAGCADCHTQRVFVTPSPAPNGVPSAFRFRPFSDFLVHDMGSLGDRIGNPGDSVAVTRRMRTAPLWGLRFRTLLLHDGRATTVDEAVRAHAGQAAASRDAFHDLCDSDRDALVAYVRSL